MHNLEITQQISEYWNIIRRRLWVWVIPLIAFPLLSLILSFFMPKIYEAKSIILIQEKQMVNPLMDKLIVTSNLAQRIEALKHEILAWPRLLVLIERLELDKGDNLPTDSNFIDTLKFEFFSKLKNKFKMHSQSNKTLSLEGIIDTLKSKIKIDMKGDEVVEIAFEGRDPHKTQQLVNTLGDILIEKNLSLQAQDTSSAIEFIKEQLDIYEKKLETSEVALRKFKEIYGDLGASDIGENDPQGGNKSSSKGSDKYLDGVTLTQINKKLGELEASLIFSSIEYTEEHPTLKDLKNQIQVIKEKRDQYIEKMSNKIGEAPQSYLNIADSIPLQQETLSRLIRDNKMNADIYSTLLQKLETAKITSRLDKSSNRTKFRVIEPARFPIKPIKPNRLKFLFFGLIIGLGIGCGLIYILEATDTSFKSEEELEEAFKIPVLGNISKFNKLIDRT